MMVLRHVVLVLQRQRPAIIRLLPYAAGLAVFE